MLLFCSHCNSTFPELSAIYGVNVGRSARLAHSLFHILLVKTNYEEFSNLQRTEIRKN